MRHAGTPASRPEELLPGYDLVFGKARAAIEAIAVGCAVIVADVHGLAGMATYADLPQWRRRNFGRTLMTVPNDVDAICAAIDRYDPDDAARCRDHVRAHWSLDVMVDALVAEYDAVYAGWDPADADHRAELTALAGPLSRLGPLRTELENARPYVEQHPEPPGVLALRAGAAPGSPRALRGPAGVPGLATVRQHPADPDVAWLVAGRAAGTGRGPRAGAGQPAPTSGAGCTLPSRSSTWDRCSPSTGVAESGVRDFTVPWHELADGRTVAAHPVGGTRSPGAPTR